MSPELLMWVEVLFNVAYLLAIWTLVALMVQRRRIVPAADWPVAGLFIAAFALLALGDTGHVGFRVLAYALGDLNATFTGLELGLVGLGALSTAITVTLFYAVMVFIWQRRFHKPLGWFGWLLLGAAVVRLALMAFPQNEWNSAVPPQPWSLYRNLPLMVQGLGVAFLILRDAFAARDFVAGRDRAFQWVGVMILVSYAFYTPVILFVQAVPAIGMLMIPKTLAYVAIAVIGYLNFFQRPALAPTSLAAR
jgi:hypothetical protein